MDLEASLQTVEGIVDSRLNSGPVAYTINRTWSDRADMWFVEATERFSADPCVSIGVKGDTVFVHAWGRDRELWGSDGDIPSESLAELLEAWQPRVR